MYINDIGLNIHSEIRLFADDILLYQPIRTPNDHLQLQGDLDTLTIFTEQISRSSGRGYKLILMWCYIRGTTGICSWSSFIPDVH